MYVRRMQRSDIQFIGGFSNDLMVRFQDVVETAMVKTIGDMVERGELMLGGEGKAVEIDEMCLTSTKYGRGRRPDQEVWVLGWSRSTRPW